MENKETSGGTRFNAGKPGMFWALPMYGLRAVARVTMMGSKKYAPLDWACGQSYSALLDSAFRHWIEISTHGPLAKDEESGLYHVAHMVWNLLCLLHFIEQGREDLDDVTKWQGVTTAMKEDMDAALDAYVVPDLPEDAEQVTMEFTLPPKKFTAITCSCGREPGHVCKDEKCIGYLSTPDYIPTVSDAKPKKAHSKILARWKREGGICSSE